MGEGEGGLEVRGQIRKRPPAARATVSSVPPLPPAGGSILPPAPGPTPRLPSPVAAAAATTTTATIVSPLPSAVPTWSWRWRRRRWEGSVPGLRQEWRETSEPEPRDLGAEGFSSHADAGALEKRTESFEIKKKDN